MNDDTLQLLLYESGELSAEERALLERRLETDEALRGELEALRRQGRLLAALPALVPGRDLVQPALFRARSARSRRAWMRMALPLAASLALMLGGFRLLRPRMDRPLAAITEPSDGREVFPGDAEIQEGLASLRRALENRSAPPVADGKSSVRREPQAFHVARSHLDRLQTPYRPATERAPAGRTDALQDRMDHLRLQMEDAREHLQMHSEALFERFEEGYSSGNKEHPGLAAVHANGCPDSI